MCNSLVYFLASYGLAWSLIYAKPLSSFKNYLKNKHSVLADLLSCIVCTGFWCGLLFSFIFFPEKTFILKISFAFSNVAFTWILANILND